MTRCAARVSDRNRELCHDCIPCGRRPRIHPEDRAVWDIQGGALCPRVPVDTTKIPHVPQLDGEGQTSSRTSSVFVGQTPTLELRKQNGKRLLPAPRATVASRGSQVVEALQCNNGHASLCLEGLTTSSIPILSAGTEQERNAVVHMIKL